MYETKRINEFDISSLIEEYEAFDGNDISVFILEWVDKLNTRR